MRTICSVLTMVACATFASAQDAATTLAEACRRADVVVHATVIGATDPSPDWHRLEFRVEAVLAGQLGPTFSVLEPAGACCGRSLFALQVGSSSLLFLQRTGATLHPFGGGRGVLPAEPALLQHVQALLAAGDDAARTEVLVAGLAQTEPRVQHDAATALASMANPTLDPAARQLVATRLADAVRDGLTTTPALAELAVRCDDATLLQDTVHVYLGATRRDQAAAVRSSLLRADPGELVQRLLPALDQDSGRQVRAAELLAELPALHTIGPMRELLRPGVHPRVKLCVAEAMLAAGHRRQQLEGLVPEAVLRLAEQRRAAPKRFRSVTPHVR